MLNIRKRFFLLLTVVGLLFGIASCTNNNDYVRLTFDNDVYEVNVGQTIDVSPIVNKGSNVGVVTIEYTSYDNQIASYSDGKLTGLQPGETIIKVVCSEHPVAYDIATVRVVPKTSVVSKVLDVLAKFYVSFFRGTPIVVQLLLFYYLILFLILICEC